MVQLKRAFLGKISPKHQVASPSPAASAVFMISTNTSNKLSYLEIVNACFIAKTGQQTLNRPTTTYINHNT